MSMLTPTTTTGSDIEIVPDPVSEIAVEPAPQRILFVAGWGRSGSTLFANVLGLSKKAINLGEFRYLWARGLHGTRCGCGEPVTECTFWEAAFQRAGWDVENLSETELSRYDSAVGATAIFRQFRALLTRRIDTYRVTHRDDIERMVSLLETVAQDPESNGTSLPVLIDTSKSIPFLINLAGDERFALDVLHLTRDPRAVAYSWSRLTDTEDADGVTFPRFGPIRSSIYWTIFNLAPLLFAKVVPGVQRHQLAYEDFVAAPQATIRAVSNHYDLDFDPAPWLDTHTVNVDLDSDPQHTISGNPSRFRLGATTVRSDQRWTTAMRRRDRVLVSALTAPARAILNFSNRRSTELVEAQR